MTPSFNQILRRLYSRASRPGSIDYWTRLDVRAREGWAARWHLTGEHT